MNSFFFSPPQILDFIGRGCQAAVRFVGAESSPGWQKRHVQGRLISAVGQGSEQKQKQSCFHWTNITVVIDGVPCFMEKQNHTMATNLKVLTCRLRILCLLYLKLAVVIWGNLSCRLNYFADYWWVELEKTGLKTLYELLKENSNKIIEHYSICLNVPLKSIQKWRVKKRGGLNHVICSVLCMLENKLRQFNGSSHDNKYIRCGQQFLSCSDKTDVQ